jgi:hypothetical protein
MEQNAAAMMNTLAETCCTVAAVLIDEDTIVIKKYDTWALYTLQHDLYTVGKVVRILTTFTATYTLVRRHCCTHYMNACVSELSRVSGIRSRLITAFPLTDCLQALFADTFFVVNCRTCLTKSLK